MNLGNQCRLDIGANDVAKSRPDGHTPMVTANGPLVITDAATFAHFIDQESARWEKVASELSITLD